jgi:hypothetical protein
MVMETRCLADHAELASQSKLTREEAYRTRLLVVDQPPRAAVRDPIQHGFRKVFRWLSFCLTKAWADTAREPTPFGEFQESIAPDAVDADALPITGRRRPRFAFAHVAWLADAFSRLFFGLMAGTMLIAPIAIFLSRPEDSQQTQLAIIALFTFGFTLIVSLTSRASPQETMVASAAYAAVLVVFVSNATCINGQLPT